MSLFEVNFIVIYKKFWQKEIGTNPFPMQQIIVTRNWRPNVEIEQMSDTWTTWISLKKLVLSNFDQINGRGMFPI